MGRIFNCTRRRDGSGLEGGYDSHVAEGGGEYIVFTKKSVLPCYMASNVTTHDEFELF